jgi:hypothetical protein
MFRHPKMSAVGNALLQPFTITVWTCVLGTWLLVLFALKISAWLESRYSDESTVESSWSATMLATVGAVSEQGSSHSGQQPFLIPGLVKQRVLSHSVEHWLSIRVENIYARYMEDVAVEKFWAQEG